MTREEAMGILEYTESNVLDARLSKALKIAIDALNEERPQGEWVFIGDNLLKCSECAYVNDVTWLGNWRQHTYDYRYPTACPNCGAKMKEVY